MYMLETLRFAHAIIMLLHVLLQREKIINKNACFHLQWINKKLYFKENLNIQLYYYSCVQMPCIYVY
jgi:hypothetical protein